MTKRWSIYAISVDGVVRYIGKSTNAPDRLRQHLREAKRPTSLFGRKLAKAMRIGAAIEQTIVRDNLSAEEASTAEVAEIAARGGHRTRGRLLWNTSAGGDGGFSPAARQAARAKWSDPEFRAQQTARGAETLLRNRTDPLFEQLRVAGVRSRAATPEGVASLAMARAAIDKSKQAAAMSAASRRMWSDPEYRARQLVVLRRGSETRWAKKRCQSGLV